ncbi:MAG: winged helix DNA-binding domain-containing protein [Chloroflexota bacterium]
MISNIGIKRLISQQISDQKFNSVKEIVSWMGAMQAQELNSVKWAIGVRLPGLTEKDVDDSVSKGEIIRTHLMRPTWHIVAAEDYLPILKLTEPLVRASLKSRRKQLGLESSFFIQSNKALDRILRNGHMTREELMQELTPLLPSLDSSRMNHVLLEAELDGLICSGKIKNRQHSFALTEEWISNDLRKLPFDRDEALALLARKYFKSHGPASVSDFNWWSGLSMGDCRKGIEIVKKDLSSEKIDSVTFWFDGEISEQVISKTKKSLFLLPAFDEFIISYKDRSAVLAYEHHEMTVSSNGIFRPVIVLDGQAIGLWNKAVKRGILIPEIRWFIKPEKKILKELDLAFANYAAFLGHPVS